MKKYLTTAIPYANGAPHIGHALDYLLADVYRRFLTMMGTEVRLSAGTDEHGSKIYNKAMELGVTPQELVDKNAADFKSFINELEVKYTDFVRTTDMAHMKRCQEIWRKLQPYIYKSRYEGWYCAGCESFVSDSDYANNDGVCPDHKKPYERLSEENYYLRISDFKSEIHEAITSGKMRILPEFRAREVLNLLENAPDVSISRPKSSLKWGVEVPDDENQVMYVWIDALANYLTVLGYPDAPEADFKELWGSAVQFVGKDILRFHAIIWPAILLGLGLELPKVIHSHGHVLANGTKMSKSLGNVVAPRDVIAKYGTEAFRYYFLRHIDTFADSDFTWEKFEAAYNGELANDYGNLVQRLANLAVKNGVSRVDFQPVLPTEYIKIMNEMRFSDGFDYVWGRVQALNQEIDQKKPWAMKKEGREAEIPAVMQDLISTLLEVNYMLASFLPKTYEKVEEVFGIRGGEIRVPETPLFPKN